jgi:hypothetical protein
LSPWWCWRGVAACCGGISQAIRRKLGALILDRRLDCLFLCSGTRAALELVGEGPIVRGNRVELLSGPA